jgi:hypothetical protein
MKSRIRFLIPIFVMAALAVSAVGVAFGREITQFEFFKIRDEEVEFTGVLEAVNGDQWTVDGQTFTVLPTAEIKGTLMVGQIVKVHALKGENGALIAREIELADADDLANENANDNVGDDNLNDNEDDDNLNDNEDDDNINDNEDDDNANDNEDDEWDDDNANDNDDDEWDDDNANDNDDGDDDDEDDSNSNDNDDGDDDDEDDSNSNDNDDDHDDDSNSNDNDDDDDGGSGDD